ncbi:uncharacterized protein LOC115756787 [Rhodamnia argentea]|uniref:Uncharacterized protein LOC115756787 n=1 Tax=Rhodamnia argentea TaxID=178133 RepID=A0A8B8QZD1_9MYRT|nr:uncharacterized protein LOC115756787 [Rhodamnia argentea]
MNPATSNNKSPHNPLGPMVKESVDRFLLEYQSGSPDFSNFTSIFSRLLHSLPDAPLEIIWFYSALTCHAAKSAGRDAPEQQVSRTKELFQLLVSCSSSCNAVKKVAVLAPVVYELYFLVIERKGLKKEVEDLLEVVVSYVSICSSREFEEEDELESSGPCFLDLIRVWIVDKPKKDVKSFFPVVSDDVRKGICEDCGTGLGRLAGVVMTEAFLLRLCLKLDARTLRAELERDMHSWAVQTIAGFRNFYFFGTLLRMLLDPVLPVTLLLKFEDEILLREVLYDALIMVDYPFLSPHNGRKLHDELLKSSAVLLLLVAETAMQFIRENGDHSKVDSYKDAVSKSCLPSQLLKWVACQTGSGRITSRPTASTPAALIKWLLIVEDLGIRVFDSDILKLHAKAVVCKSRIEHDNAFILSPYNEGVVEDIIDDADLDMVDSMDATFMAYTCPVVLASDGTRKRKDGRKEEGEIPVKFLKSHIHENVAKSNIFHSCVGDGLSSRNEEYSPILQEDILSMEQ